MPSEEGQGKRMPGAVLIAVGVELTLLGAGRGVWGAAVGRMGLVGSAHSCAPLSVLPVHEQLHPQALLA